MNDVVGPAVLQRSTRLPPVPASAREARRVVRDALTEVGEQDLVHAAVLAVSELVTNAILHAGTPVELDIEVTERDVTVWVRDEHPQLPVPRRPASSSTTGRGLAIVAALVDEHGVDLRPPGGKSVWFRLRRHEFAAAATPGS
jgi:anti-sigma regulatory factor (Ser/Thr protein kinase)